MTTYASTTSAYRSNAVLTASSPQLIVMLYDGARRFLHQASVAMTQRDIPTAHNKLRSAELIIRHLRNTLDFEHGEIPRNLASIYSFSLRQCQRARFDQNPALLGEVSGLLGQLRGAWAQIAEEAVGEHPPTAAPRARVGVLAG